MIDDKADDLRRLLQIADYEVSVGIHEAEGAESHGTLTNAEVGAIHEEGTEKIPQRSFIRGYYDENEAQIGELADRAMAKVLEGTPPKQAYGVVGEFIEAGIKERMLARIPPELAESTKRRRGEDAVPLVDSSQLMGAIKNKVTQLG